MHPIQFMNPIRKKMGQNGSASNEGESAVPRAKIFPVDLFGPVSKEKYWPQRLLHLPTMTSVQRQGKDSYATSPGSSDLVNKPSYAALSYTWGRFERRPFDASHDRLEVHGVDWDVPAIADDHFTVGDFERVLHCMEKVTVFAWVDIACIHQSDTLLKMKEVGEQGKIFRQASTVFVWLSEIPSSTLLELAGNINALVDIRADEYDSSHLETIESALVSVRELVEDPWFSSLWTLQESQLQQGAKVVSQDARVVIDNPLLAIPSFGGNYKTTDSSTVAKIYEIVEFVQAIGYTDQLANPNATLYASQLRKTSLVQDRIYATMSLYGLKLRTSRIDRDPYEYSMDDLQYAFTAAISKDQPGLGQYFIHTIQPTAGFTWQLVQSCRKIAGAAWSGALSARNTKFHILATKHGYATFVGKVCSLDMVLRSNYPLHIDLDEYLVTKYPPILQAYKQHHQDAWWDEPKLEEYHVQLAKALFEAFSENDIFLLRLRLGDLWQTPCVILLRRQGRKSMYTRLGLCHLWGRWISQDVVDESALDWKYKSGEIH